MFHFQRIPDDEQSHEYIFQNSIGKLWRIAFRYWNADLKANIFIVFSHTSQRLQINVDGTWLPQDLKNMQSKDKLCMLKYKLICYKSHEYSVLWMLIQVKNELYTTGTDLGYIKQYGRTV